MLAPQTAETLPDGGREKVRPIPPVRPPTTLINTAVATCDARYRPRNQQKLCVDFVGKDSFKPGEPLTITIEAGDIPEGTPVMVSLARLAIVTFPYHTRPVEGYSASARLLQAYNIKPNSVTTLTWDSVNGPCARTAINPECTFTQNLPAGRYILRAVLLDDAYWKHAVVIATQADGAPDDGGTDDDADHSGGAAPPARQTVAHSRSFAIDAPLDWSGHMRTADYAVPDYAYSQIAGNYSVKFKDSLKLTPAHDGFVQDKQKRWCRTYNAANVARGDVTVCLPPFTVSEYGLWSSSRDSQEFLYSGQISFARNVPDVQQSVLAAREQLNKLYANLLVFKDRANMPRDVMFAFAKSKEEQARIYAQYPEGPFVKNVSLKRARYMEADKKWVFTYGVELQRGADTARQSQSDTVTMMVAKGGEACISDIRQSYGGRRVWHRLARKDIAKIRCASQ